MTLRTRISSALVALSFAALGPLACSDDATPGGATATDGGGTADGGAGGDGGGGTCAGATASRLAPIPPNSFSLQAGNGGLYVIDRDGGPETIAGIHTQTLVKVGGGVVFTPNASETILSATVSGDDAYVAVASASNGGFGGRLVAVDLRSGTARDLLATGISRSLAEVFATDATYIYLSQETASGDMGLFRIARAGGPLDELLRLPSAAFGSLQLQGGDLWFSAGRESIEVMRLRGAAPGAAEVVGKLELPFPFVVTDEAIWVPSGTVLVRYERDLKNPKTVFDVLAHPYAANGGGPTVAAATAKEVIVRLNRATEGPLTLVGIDRATLAATPLVCSVGTVRDVIAPAGKLQWLERGVTTAEPAAVFEATR